MSEAVNKEEQAMEPVETGMEEKTKRAKGIKRGKRKIKKRWILLGAVVLLGALWFGVTRSTAGGSAIPVEAVVAYTGDLEEKVSVSGKVESANKEVFFSPVNAKIAELNAAVGDRVKVGDLLLAFDTKELEENKTKADLQVSQAANGYQSMLRQSNENQSEYSEATIGLEELKQLKQMQEQYVLGLTYELQDETAAKRESLKNWMTKLQEELDYQNRKLSKKREEGQDVEQTLDNIESVQKQLYDTQNRLEMLENDEVLKQKQRIIDIEQKKLEDMTEEIGRRESKQSASESGILDGYAKKEKEAGVESAKLDAKDAKETLERAQEGIHATFDGIVTEVSVMEGASVAQGAQLFTVESSEQIKVSVELGRYDLEKVKEGQRAEVTIAGNSYEGSVEKISRMAQVNEQNAQVIKAEIVVNNPDEGIFLGVEGKASIHVAQADNAVLVPYEAVNTDMEGDFCYVVKEGLVAKQRVVTGISNDTDVEIKEGLVEGDTVITAADVNLEEGMQVLPVVR